MKKLVALAALVLSLGAMPLLSHADSQKACPSDAGAPANPGCVTVNIDQDNETGYVDADGDKANEDPTDGYIRVTGDSSGNVNCYAEDKGSYDVAEEGEEVPDNDTCQETIESQLP